MLLTRKSTSTGAATRSPLVHSLTRGVSRAIPTMDRRAFLRRSGLGLGAGMAGSQLLTLRKAQAADAPKGATPGGAKVEVKRTVCGHCSVGLRGRCGGRERRVGAPGAGIRFADQPGRALREGGGLREHGHGEFRLKYPMKLVDGKYQRISVGAGATRRSSDRLLEVAQGDTAPIRCTWIGSSKHNNEQSYLLRKFDVLLGQPQLRPPGAHLPLHHGPASPTPGGTAR